MGWNAYRTPRNTLHVIHSDTGVNFEAADEEEAQSNISAIGEAAKRAEEQAKAAEEHADDFAAPVGETTLRVN